jgi:signal transduction histidine kinase
MKALNQRTLKLSTLVTLTIAVIVALMQFSHLSVPTSFSFSVGYVKDKINNEMIELPQTKIPVNNSVTMEGELVTPKRLQNVSYEATYAYIPKFEGDLEILADGKEIFRGFSPTYLGGSGSVLLAVPMRANGELPVLEFSLKQHSKRFILLSNIYLGSYDDFRVPEFSQNQLQLLEISVFGMTISVLLICVLLLVNRIQVYSATSTAVISSFFLLSSLNSLDGILDLPVDYIFRITLAAPFVSSNMYLLGESLAVMGKPSAFWKVQISAVALSAAIIVSGETLLSDFAPLPLLTSLVFIILPAPFYVARALFLGWVKNSQNLLLFGMMLLVFEVGLTHDAMVRFNYFSNDHYLISLVRISFVFACAYLLTSYTLAGSRQLQNANDVLNSALEARTKELVSEFSKTEKLLAQRAVALETRRIREELEEDLHDGVLSYISVINVLTEASKDATMMQVNKLSRFASNEIRLMMETSEKQPMSLLPAISLLRRQFIDRLSEVGIDVHFDVARLSACGHIEHKVVVEYARMLQELVHNAAVRAGARRIEISGEPLSSEDDSGTIHYGFLLLVNNTGGTTYDPQKPSGNGIRNIVNRSSRVGGQFKITPIDGGASAVLTWTGIVPGAIRTGET